jgi:phosphomannomutase
MHQTTSLLYQCPGERQPITRPVHLGRLASFYAACRTCPHREDTAPLSGRQIQQLQQIQRHAPRESLFDDEGVRGTHLNDIHAADVYKAAAAFGIFLRRDAAAGISRPTVVIGADGRPLTAELTAAASDGLRYAGCNVVDVGFATAPCVVFAVDHVDADGGLIIGNSTGRPLEVDVRFWSRGGNPLSVGGRLDGLQQLIERSADRPTRSCGSTRRFRADVPYLACLTKYFHALRPLRFVLDTPSDPTKKYLQQLVSSVACEIISIGRGRPAKENEEPPPLDHLVAAVVRDTAHFGVRVDGDGEILRVVDQRGRIVEADRISLLLLEYLDRQHPRSTFVLEESSHQWIAERLTARKAIVHRAPPPRGAMFSSIRANTSTSHSASGTYTSRETMFTAVGANGAIAAGGPSGRIWFGEKPVAADAFQAIAILLNILSERDSDLSERLADLCP